MPYQNTSTKSWNQPNNPANPMKRANELKQALAAVTIASIADGMEYEKDALAADLRNTRKQLFGETDEQIAQNTSEDENMGTSIHIGDQYFGNDANLGQPNDEPAEPPSTPAEPPAQPTTPEPVAPVDTPQPPITPPVTTLPVAPPITLPPLWKQLKPLAAILGVSVAAAIGASKYFAPDETVDTNDVIKMTIDKGRQ